LTWLLFFFFSSWDDDLRGGGLLLSVAHVALSFSTGVLRRKSIDAGEKKKTSPFSF
jgi:hypothetical protein